MCLTQMNEPRYMTASSVEKHLLSIRQPERVKLLQGYFKTGPGEYSEGDQFLGLSVPTVRTLAREYRALPLPEVVELLASEWHEARLLALLIMVDQYGRGDAKARKAVYDTYLANTHRVNNWDLVDSSAAQIVGAHLFERSRSPLRKLAKSRLIWERRMAIIATAYFIKRNDFDETLAIAEFLLGDREDLIHKAVGWMLREVGNRDVATEEAFLRAHYRKMPRTALRYAIEKFPAEKRRAYLEAAV
jgi:3-methyladenine DNA glycosylase AlkD